MTNLTHKYSLPIATLGPIGTDAEWVASGLSATVLLYPTFRSALKQACNQDCIALVACGCMSDTECWVDLHFEFLEMLQIISVMALPTKPMCFAKSVTGSDLVRSVAVYPAVRQLAAKRTPTASLVFYPNKPAAVLACAQGETDSCIGSEEIVVQHPRLVVVERISATMVWALYARSSLELGLNNGE